MLKRKVELFTRQFPQAILSLISNMPCGEAEESVEFDDIGLAQILLLLAKKCKRCEAIKPPQAHHCRVCDSCVAGMDHHCPWVNNCVGRRNQKHFLLFLAYTCIGSLVAVSLIGFVGWQCFFQGECG
jgi:ribosomal protein L40E